MIDLRRFRDLRVERIVLIAAVVGGLVYLYPKGEDMTGAARAVDGDTLLMGEQHIGLFGVDAPEAGQNCTRAGEPYACGADARAALAALIGGRSVTCKPAAEHRYGRALATCFVGGSDLGQELVKAGWALQQSRFTNRYEAVEAEARAARRGLWQGDFETPESRRLDS